MRHKPFSFKFGFRFTAAFVVYHTALIAGLAYILLSGRLSVTTNFMSLLPTNGVSENVAHAEKTFVSKQNASVTILAGHPDFDTAKRCAERMYEELNAANIFAEINLDNSHADIHGFSTLLSKYRYRLLPEYAAEEITRDPEAFQTNCLASIFSPLAFNSFANLDSDPFFVDNIIASDFLQKLNGLMPAVPREGVLAINNTGVWYIMIRGTLSEKALDISNAATAGAGVIFTIGDKIKAETPGLSVSYSGFPFHSYESAATAQKEIAVITAVATTAVAFLFLILLGNIHVIGLFLLGTFFSLLSAFAAISICFPDIHILTLVFGTSLIGTSIDYTIHYYLAYAKRKAGDDGRQVVRRLSKNLAVSLASTELCYLLILFSPYGILKQVALFCAAGLASSFLTVTGLFPVIIRQSAVSEKALAWKLPEGKRHRSHLIPLLVASLAVFAFNVGKLHVKNNILDLYQMSDRLLESEKTVGSVLGFTGTTYAIIEGEDECDAREKEHAFAREMGAFRSEGLIDNYLSISTFIPAPSVQQKSLDASQKLIPLLDSQTAALGIHTDAARAALEARPPTLGVSDAWGVSEQTAAALEQLVPGDIGGKYYLAAVIRGATDFDAISAAAAKHDGVTYFQKSKDVDRQLDELTTIILQIFAVAFVIIILLLAAVFKKKGLSLALSPVITITALLAAAGAFGMRIDFFFAVGMLLVMGLGLDYMVFAGNSEKKPMLAITLSYVTTALSFGTLAFSSFRPVHIFGVTVFIGITAAFITALCSGNADGKKTDDISSVSRYTDN